MTLEDKAKRDLKAARMIAAGVDLPTVASRSKVSVKTLYVRGVVEKGYAMRDAGLITRRKVSRAV